MVTALSGVASGKYLPVIEMQRLLDIPPAVQNAFPADLLILGMFLIDFIF